MASSHGSSTTLELVLAAVMCALLLAPPSSGAEPPLSGSYEDDKVHDFLRVMDRAAAYRRECFGECAKGCYCSDNPYSCLRECMPTPPTRRCGATYDVVQGVFSSSATFLASTTMLREDKDAAGSGEGFVSTSAT
ncbi:unnamed protein product [Miscanthus lutarioriparius]|uniref:Uncharacterized protein n=1 Tax=Miscanthus lutarioriparius TaxID=422564 RepID=A0A811QCV3_9POAL|nr:unnamed protein product [Miscanthus lutarioriparius]